LKLLPLMESSMWKELRTQEIEFNLSNPSL
jgi:hypothetical protein